LQLAAAWQGLGLFAGAIATNLLPRKYPVNTQLPCMFMVWGGRLGRWVCGAGPPVERHSVAGRQGMVGVGGNLPDAPGGQFYA